MSIDRIAIKQEAKDTLSQQYWPLVGWGALVSVITAIIAALSRDMNIASFMSLVNIFLMPVLTAGLAFLSYKAYRKEPFGAEELFAGFKNYGHVLGGMLWEMLFVLLWFLIPLAGIVMAIIKILAYSMTPYILLDQPEVSATDALKLSMEMTEGYKGEIFMMYLSFFGWLILSGLTLGLVGVFYASPYMSLTIAGYYDYLKEQYAKEHPAEYQGANPINA